VRVIADLEDRVREEMERENISAEQARYTLLKDDEERRKWGLQLYGHDTKDSSLYDLVVHIKTKTVDDAVSLVMHAARLPCYQTTAESQKRVNDLALAAEVKAALIDHFPGTETSADDGVVSVKVDVPHIQEKQAYERVRQLVEKVEGVKEVRVHIVPFPLARV
jgi:hypothetical protein